MFNVRNNTIYMAAIALLLCSCSSKKDPRVAEAENLYAGADAALAEGNPSLALELLDSLDSGYKTVTEVIKKSIALRPKAVIGQSEAEITRIDSLLAAGNAKLDSMASLIRHVDVPGTDGFNTPVKSYNPSFASSTGVSPRIDDLGQFYMVSSVNPAGNLRHTSLTFSAGNVSVTTADVASGSDSNFRINNGEMVTFSPALSDTIAGFIMSLPSGSKVSVRFNGQGGKGRSAKVDYNAFHTAIEYSSLISEMRRLTIERQRQEARIETATRQSAKAAENQAE